jgi:hypothetical protein
MVDACLLAIRRSQNNQLCDFQFNVRLSKLDMGLTLSPASDLFLKLADVLLHNSRIA